MPCLAISSGFLCNELPHDQRLQGRVYSLDPIVDRAGVQLRRWAAHCGGEGGLRIPFPLQLQQVRIKGRDPPDTEDQTHSRAGFGLWGGLETDKSTV